MMMEMRVDKIIISNRYTRTPPKESKVENHAVYYIKHRQFKKQIVVTQNGITRLKMGCFNFPNSANYGIK